MLVSTGLLAWVISGPDLDLGVLVTMLAAMLGDQIVIGVSNELVDAETDRTTKPSKPIASGQVTLRGARMLLIAGMALMVVAGISLGFASFLILMGGTVVGVAYSLWFKRGSYAWLPYLIALPLLPIWVAVTLDRFEPALLLLYPLGALAVLSVQFAQSVPDVAADRTAGIVTLTTRLGERRTLFVCWAAMLASSMLALGAAIIRTGWDWRLGLAAVIVAGLTGIDAVLYRKDERAGIMAAFPVVAASTALLGVTWVWSIYR